MGKATIQAGGADGRYNIVYNVNRSRMEERIAKLAGNIQQAETVELPVLEAALASVEAAILDLEGQLNTAIAYGYLEAMRSVTSYLTTARMQLGSASSQVAGKKAEIASLKASKAFLEKNLPTDPELEAWCADFNEGLTGEVGTIEVPGERTAPIIIRPAGEFAADAAYNAASDGQIIPGLALSPEEAFYNQAMLPGWQRWQPKFRLATITAIDNLTDTCEIVLDAAFSTQKDEGGVPFDANQTAIYGNQPVYEDVPIVYMRCNSHAFGVGDRVVVRFERNLLNEADPLDYRPTVIGFESNPKECIDHYLHALDKDSDIIRSYRLTKEIWPEFVRTGLINRFYTPVTIEKRYKDKIYTLFTDEFAPKITINDNGVITEYPLPPIQQDANWYNVKRLEVKDDAIYIHDYAYSYAKWTTIAEWNANQLRLPISSQRMRIMAYTLNMTLTGTTYRGLPFFFGAHISSDKIYMLGGRPYGGDYTEEKLYEYNHEWVYQGESFLNFSPGREQSITGWLNEKIIIGNRRSADTDQGMVCCFDSNHNQLWATALGLVNIQSVVTDGRYVYIGAHIGWWVGETFLQQGRIYTLDINTGQMLRSYDMPLVPNPGLVHSPSHDENGNPYPPVDGPDTVYLPSRMAVSDGKLYVGIGLMYAYLNTNHPRAFIFDVSNGNFNLENEGFPAVIGMFPGQEQGVGISQYFYFLKPFAVSSGKKAWWMLLDRVDDYHLQVFSELGGIYIFNFGEIVPIGSLGDYFQTNSSAMF